MKTYNIKEFVEDTNDLCDGLFMITCEDKQDAEILERMRKIAQKLNEMFNEILESRIKED